MATSEITIEGIGTVRIFRRRGLKNIRISIGRDGGVRLSIPWYVSRSAGIRYLVSKYAWIEKHRPNQTVEDWQDGNLLVKRYTLRLHYSESKYASSKLSGQDFHIYLPRQLSDNAARQKIITKNIKKLLVQMADEILGPLIEEIATNKGFKLKSVRYKSLKSRWGSCNQAGVITLNLSLLQLPDELIKYVAVHEVAHLKHMNHSQKFWQEVAKTLPDYKDHRKVLRQFNPARFS